MYIEKLASQIKNDILSGLRGYHQNLSLSDKQLEDEVVQARLAMIKQYLAEGMINIRDLFVAINCVSVDCESLERCSCGMSTDCGTLVAHFQIPQLIWDIGPSSLDYVGSVDRLLKYNVVSSLSELQMRKYRKRGKDKPFVWLDFAPNSSGLLDCFLFNAPMVEQVSVVGAFKDPRQVESYSCCSGTAWDMADANISAIDQLVKDSIIESKIKYYRQLAAPLEPNDQKYRPAT